MLHARSRSKELIDRLNYLGLSIFYDRVIRLFAHRASSVCEQYHREQVVCPPKSRGAVFTTAAVDNIDHNPSSTTSKESFHGTGISLLQHPTVEGEGTDRYFVFAEESGNVCQKSVDYLPHFYTDVPPITSSIKKSAVPASNVTSLLRDNFLHHTSQEYVWLDHTHRVLTGESEENFENMSWAAYHVSHQPSLCRAICPTALSRQTL